MYVLPYADSIFKSIFIMHTKENPHMYMDIYWHIHVCVYVCVFVKHKTKGESRESKKGEKQL